MTQAQDPTTTQAKLLEAKNLREESQQAQQRQRMARWRMWKKNLLKNMNLERKTLEQKLQRLLAELRLDTEVCSSVTQQSYQCLALESAALTRENLALKIKLEEHAKFRRGVQSGCCDSPMSSTILPREEVGWRVFFPNCKPSFHFQPFSRAEFDDAFQQNDVKLVKEYPCTATVGNIFGWKVDYAPLARNTAGTSMVAHVQFSKRLRCSLDRSNEILLCSDKKLYPSLVSPRSWGRVQHGDVCIKVLQTFSANALVLAYNTPCEDGIHLRCIGLAYQMRSVLPDGRRVDTYTLLVEDSEANKRHREAEGPQQNVQWITEGKTYMTLTEIDDTTIDVVYDQSAEWLYELRGQVPYIDWIRYAVQVEQLVVPTGLLIG